MKRFLFLGLLAGLLFACSQPSSPAEATAESVEPDSPCQGLALIENTQFCLPDYDGYTDVYAKLDAADDQGYSTIMSQLSKQNNQLLAFYVQDGDVSGYGYTTIYYSKSNAADLDADQFNKVSSAMGDYLKGSSAPMVDFASFDVENVALEKPIVVETYKPADNVETYVLLGRANAPNQGTIILTSMNLIHQKEKMVILNHTIQYENPESIVTLKELNNKLVLGFIGLN